MPKNLYDESIEFIRKTLERTLPAGAVVFLFGSRAREKSGRRSDIDLAVEADNLPKTKIDELREFFEESFVPWKVDLVDLKAVNNEFREEIMKDAKIWMRN